MSEKFKLCQWDIKRADSELQTEREREGQERGRERGRETRRMTEIQRSTEY